MFILIRIFGMLFLVTQCKNTVNQVQHNPKAQQETAISMENNATAQEELLTVTYKAESRGAFYKVVVNNQHVEKFKNRSLNDKKIKSCSKKEWSTIQSELDNIDVKKIKELKAPSDNKNVDRSLHAMLTITFSSQEYTSVPFDHGNPPEQLVPLLNTILSLAESIE